MAFEEVALSKEKCQMHVIRTLAAVWLAMRVPGDAKLIASNAGRAPRSTRCSYAFKAVKVHRGGSTELAPVARVLESIVPEAQHLDDLVSGDGMRDPLDPLPFFFQVPNWMPCSIATPKNPKCVDSNAIRTRKSSKSNF